MLTRVLTFARARVRPTDLGYGDLGFNGHPTTKTDNINKLAYSGKVSGSA